MMTVKQAIKKGLARDLGDGIIGPGPKMLEGVDMTRTVKDIDGNTYYPLKGETAAQMRKRHAAIREKRRAFLSRDKAPQESKNQRPKRGS
jgi:hypothetical protein